jgi:hypothetical protein
MLEPLAFNGARAVLRRGGARKGFSLSDLQERNQTSSIKYGIHISINLFVY